MSKARGMSAPSRSRDSDILIFRSQDGGEKDRNMYLKGPAAHVHGHLVHVLRWLDPSCVCLGFDPLCVGREEKERRTTTRKNPGSGRQGGLTGWWLCRSGWCTVTLCSGADARTQTASVWAHLHP